MKTHVHTHKVYKFKELSEDAQAAAIEKNYDWNVDGSEWYDFAFEDAKEIGLILGIEIDKIYFSGFSSQGDGAQFVGDYSYAKQAPAKIKAYAPQDNELYNIAKGLQELQRKNFYCLFANVKHHGHYNHENCTDIQVMSDNEGMGGANDDAYYGIKELLRDFMRWIYKRLNAEYDYLVSDEAIKESLICNEMDFNEDGSIH